MFSSSSSLLFRKAFGTRLLNSTLSCRAFSTPNPQLNLTRLDNGFRVTTEENSGNIAVVGLTIDAGISHQKEDNGVATAVGRALLQNAHFLSQEPELGGPTGTFSTHTNRDRTVLSIACMKDVIPAAVEQLAGILKSLRLFSPEQFLIAAQARDILASRTPEDIVQEHLYSIAFQGHPLSFSGLGTTTPTAEDFTQFVETNITAPRIILSGVGVLHENLVEHAKRNFSELPNLAGPIARTPRYVGAKADVRDDFLSHVHISYAVQAPSRSSNFYLVARVIQAILGNWDISHGVSNNTTSRLAETAALEHLAIKVKAFYEAHQTTGLLGVHTVASPHEIEDFSVEVLTEFVRISQKVGWNEVERAKRRVKHELLASVSTSHGLLDTISEQVFYQGRRTPIQDLLTKLEGITPTEVKNLAEEILYDVDPVISAHGPTTYLPDYNRLRSWIYWNRL